MQSNKSEKKFFRFERKRGIPDFMAGLHKIRNILLSFESKKLFFRFIGMHWQLPELVLSSDHPPVKCLEALTFPWLTFKVTSYTRNLKMICIPSGKSLHDHGHNLKMTPKVHVLVLHVSKYVRCTGVPPEPTSKQVLENQHTLVNIFYHRYEVNCAKSPVFWKRLLNAV